MRLPCPRRTQSSARPHTTAFVPGTRSPWTRARWRVGTVPCSNGGVAGPASARPVIRVNRGFKRSELWAHHTLLDPRSGCSKSVPKAVYRVT